MMVRILKYPWHTGHDYELAKLNHSFFYLTNTHREWSVGHRPIPASITWVPSMDTVGTDVMILHVDQWSWFEPSKRFLFLNLKEAYEGPKIVINHGCNMVDGVSSDIMREMVKGCVMVCNSSTARDLWDVPGSTYIRHGMSPEEWPPTDYARNEIVLVEPYSNLHQEYRNYDLIERVEEFVPITWIGRDRTFDSFEKYRQYLSHASVYFNPCLASPNPRSRTEAMLMGLAIVTTDEHGESEYIENGVNGFATSDPAELIEALEYLLSDPDEARRIGEAGRQTARRLFHIDRFREQWDELLRQVVA